MSTHDPVMGFKRAKDIMRRRKVLLNQRRSGPFSSPRVTIGSLPDNVLLDIFDFYRMSLYITHRWWHALVHVCQRWRYVVFASPLRLDLQLVCNLKTPVEKTLNVWPLLPITIYEPRRNIVLNGGANITSALKHHDRVGKVFLPNTTSTLLKRLYKVMKKPYPILTDLRLKFDKELAPVVPDTFLGRSAPSLSNLNLSGIPFPTLPKFLLSCHNLVDVRIWNIPNTAYISPEAMATALSALTKLKSLSIGLEFSASSPDQAPPPLTHIVLPTLINFTFHGASEYFEDFVARIDTPVIRSIKTEFFNQLDFDIPQFLQFISRTQIHRSFKEAKLYFVDRYAYVIVGHPDLPRWMGFRIALSIKILCRALDWQVSCLAQICSKFSPFLSNVERLHIADSDPDHWHYAGGRTTYVTSSNWKDYVDNSQWLDLFHAFSAVRHMEIPPTLGEIIASALQELAGERTMDALPMLRDLYLSPSPRSASVQQVIGPFISSRQLSNRPVIFHHPVTFRLAEDEEPLTPSLHLQPST